MLEPRRKRRLNLARVAGRPADVHRGNQITGIKPPQELTFLTECTKPFFGHRRANKRATSGNSDLEPGKLNSAFPKVIAKIGTDKINELSNFLITRVHKVPGVKDTETLPSAEE